MVGQNQLTSEQRTQILVGIHDVPGENLFRFEHKPLWGRQPLDEVPTEVGGGRGRQRVESSQGDRHPLGTRVPDEERNGLPGVAVLDAVLEEWVVREVGLEEVVD